MQRKLLTHAALVLSLFASPFALALQPILPLDSSCVVNVLNRTVQAKDDGSFNLPNVPSFMGQINARATCVRDGKTVIGQSDYFRVRARQNTEIGQFFVSDNIDIPTELLIQNTRPIQMSRVVASQRLRVVAAFPNGSTADAADDINFTSSNAAVASVNANPINGLRFD